VQPKPGERILLIMDPNFPLTLVNWDLTSIQGTEDKYDKTIVGKVKNNFKGTLPEVRIEFTLYDEKGTQIAVVSENAYDLRPGEIWNFEMPVTHDVEKVEPKGLYCVPPRELKGSEVMEG